MERVLHMILVLAILIQVINGNKHRHQEEIDCSKCRPGYRVAVYCNQTRDTVCVPCEPNTYLPHHSHKSECYMCSKCGEDLYVAKECSPERDTLCDSCLTYKGPRNSNYYARCAKFQHLDQGEARRTIPSTRQMGRLRTVDNKENEPNHASDTYLAMMLVGVGACAVACLITGIVVYGWYGKKKWTNLTSLYKNVNLGEATSRSQL